MQILADLGAALDAAWQRLDYDERAFPGLAAAALRERRLHRDVDVRDVLRWLLTAADLPPQSDLAERFGQPPISVYVGRRFFIQVLLWLEGSTAVHRHGFSGAFMVLAGTSLHTRHAFTCRRRVSSRLLLGELRLVEATTLVRGDVTPITNDLIHGLYHLDAPSATVVVRTHREDEAGPQYTYLPPSLAVDPFFQDPVATRKLQGLRFMRRAGDPEHPDHAAALIAASDLHTGFLVLQQAYRGPPDPALGERLIAAMRRRHGDVTDELVAALHEERRVRRLQQLRAAQTDPTLRHFLALLQNLPDRASLLAQLQRAAPDVDPRERAWSALRALSGVDGLGVDLDDELNHLVVAALLDGLDDDALFERLAGVYGADEVGAQREPLRRHVRRIRRTALAPLLNAAAP